jgi:hypothetical protein
MQINSFTILWKDWNECEKAVFDEAVLKYLRQTVVKYTMPDGQAGIGVPMRAIVAVSKK